jgi:hypothetical protein
MQKKITLICLLLFITPFFLFPQVRSFAELFPAMGAEQRIAAFSASGYLYYGDRAATLTLNPQTPDNTAISKSSLGPNPGIFVEALRVLPNKGISLLNVYNALERVRDLKGRTYSFDTRKKQTPLFTDAIRIENPQKIRAFLPDPPPAFAVPYREVFYVRLTDALFGHCYFEVTLASSTRGILYRLNNFKTVTVGPFTVMKEKTFFGILYIEQVEEGLVLYCLAGAEVTDFIIKHVNVGSALNKRLDVLTAWLLDGLPH